MSARREENGSSSKYSGNCRTPNHLKPTRFGGFSYNDTMHKLTNLTNSPFDIPTPSGSVLLPALGTIECEVDNEYLKLLILTNSVQVESMPRRGRPPKEKTE